MRLRLLFVFFFLINSFFLNTTSYYKNKFTVWQPLSLGIKMNTFTEIEISKDQISTDRERFLWFSNLGRGISSLYAQNIGQNKNKISLIDVCELKKHKKLWSN